jgi:hypothetical protein
MCMTLKGPNNEYTGWLANPGEGKGDGPIADNAYDTRKGLIMHTHYRLLGHALSLPLPGSK